jgi:uncharacterized damage-inducible protein DinB
MLPSLRAEFARYKKLGEGAMAQLTPEEFSQSGPRGGSSIATICWHISGNLESRFTDFLTTDGEKPWRNREEEFDPRRVSRDELLAKWERGWSALSTALDELREADLTRTVTIRNEPHTVPQALHRALAHIAYHVGQMVYVAKEFRGDDWKSLSIPRAKR